MTEAEQRLEDDKMRVEIAKLVAEVTKIREETARTSVEIGKLAAERRQISVMTFIAPFATAAAVMGATAGLVKVFLG